MRRRDAAGAWRDNRLSANGDTQARRILFIAGLTDHYALSYDGLNRLTKVVAPVSESFTLDPASNIDLRSGPTQDFSYDQANRLTTDGAQTYTWSNADRLSSRGPDIFGYNALDRLTSSTVAGTARSYTYNGDGLLKSRTQGTATQFLWDPSTSPSRELKQGSDNIVFGLGPLYVVRGDGTTVTFARDGGKSVRAELNASGAVTAVFRYRAYGQIAQSTGTGTPSYLGYAGQLLDPSGLYYMRARWYDPVIGRFLTPDPVPSIFATPATVNTFLYAAANPTLNIDPSGGRWAESGGIDLNGSLDDCEGGGRCGGGPPEPGPGPAGAGSRRGGSAPVLKGQAGVAVAEADVVNAGQTVIGRQVTFDTSAGRIRVDLVVQDQRGRMYLLEVKAGPTAEFTAGQARRYSALASEGGVPVGANAIEAGFTPGVPIGPLGVEAVWILP
ncbi:MAG: hypothetical protein M3O91_01740 [Chloroflexota bacterium]|nr:hypothetical protein [Chloroflexota bacterium]